MRQATVAATNSASALPLPKFMASLTWFFAVHAMAVAALMACGLLMNGGSVAPTATKIRSGLELPPPQL
jgi:hypothetical protein